MAPSIDVDPDDLDALGTVVHTGAGRIRSALAAFEGPALGVNDAFGWLGPSAEILRDYLELAQGCVNALGDLEGTFDSMATGLQVSAERYRAAEQANTNRE